MPNSYTFDQIATVLNNIVADAQGRTPNIATTPRNTSDFVTMATTAMSMGTDPIMRSLTQMINKTIFAYRPYNRKFKMLERDNIEFGNMIRKITPIFTDGAENQPMYDAQPADGGSTDQYTIKRPKTLETHFVGAEQYEVQAPTVFVNQLKTAFRGPDELSQFLAAQVGEVSNEIEQQTEQLARMTVTNFIAAKIKCDQPNVIHLITEYNSETGAGITPADVYAPENFPNFVKWMYSRLATISQRLTERTTKYHKGISGYDIVRHTPANMQQLLIYAPVLAQIKTRVMGDVFHNEVLTLQNYESVGFWQNINQPDSINVNCNYIDAGGAVQSGTVAADNVFAVLYDRDAMGINILNEGVAMSPLNAKGQYYNTFHHFAKRYNNDLTENAVVLLLD